MEKIKFEIKGILNELLFTAFYMLLLMFILYIIMG